MASDLPSSPHQNVHVTGAGNQVLVAGGDIYQVTLRLPEPLAADRPNLLNLLARVRQTWMHVLERSIGDVALPGLPMRAVPREVEQPWARVLEVADGHERVLPPGTPIGQVFDEVDRTLLILGEPGAGKTTTLLTLARECIERAERDATAPVPVVLNLSTWASSRKTIHDWVVGELAARYYVGEPFARRWLHDHRLLLLLDGLDEVAEARRVACVQALHTFVVETGISGLAVCCRTREYRALPVRLRLGGAVSLLPLGDDQVEAFLDRAGPTLAGLRAAFGRNAELRALAESPLMLNLMAVAYAGASADVLDIGGGASREAWRDAVFRRYVDRMFVLRTRAASGFLRQRIEDSLHWLARGMMARGESIFAIELLQPAWLTRGQILFYALLSRIAGAVVTAVAIAAIIYIAAWVVVFIVDTPFAVSPWVLGAGLSGGIVYGLVCGSFYAPFDFLRLARGTRSRVRSPGMLEELGAFFSYVALAITAAVLVWAVAVYGVGLSPLAPGVWAGMITIGASLLSLPLLFCRKAGRGEGNRDISMAGTLTWNLQSSWTTPIICTIAGMVLLAFSPRLGIQKVASAVIMGAMTFAVTVYGNWRHEVPRVDAWNDDVAVSTVRRSIREFAFAALLWILIFAPVLWFAVDAWRSFMEPLAVAVFTSIVVVTPALFWFGGFDVVLHGSLRLVLALTGAAPLRLRRVLDYGVHLGFLQRAGGGYIFIHRLLLEHFATAPQRSAGRASP